MKRRFLILLLLLILGGYIASAGWCKELDGGFCYSNFSKKELLKDLVFAERQVFDNTYTSDNITERLERLEIEVFGAIQDGREDFRIKRLKKSVTNVASGGNGLSNALKTLNLGGNSVGMTSWVIGNMHNFYPYTNSYYSGRNSYRSQSRGYSHRLPPPPMYPNHSYNNNPITNGDFTKNYSIGTGIKILDD
ncbi:MAG: hypothetical protein K6A44_01230 [bacterium]|nr:hypothetical protein [bacterium]